MSETLDRLRAALEDRYTVEREIGRGGTATVYLATDLRHSRPVAIKVLQPELAAVLGPERFLQEIQTSARLNHPHILPLHDSGEVDGYLYCVMPYVEGESLRERLEDEKQLPLDDALRIAREVADALSYAHAQGVVHRDIKPENILLQAGHAVVADFGIARAIDMAGGERLTETGIAVGTPLYMSPEQASGSRELDGRSDLYSLGCVLFEMLAGTPPFAGPTTASLVHQHLAADPPNVTTIRPSVPDSVAAAVTRALAKTPADRFNPVAQFGEAITSVIPTAGHANPLARTRVPRSAWIGGVAAVVVVVVVTASLLLPGRRSTLEPIAVAVLPFVNLTAEGPNEFFADALHGEVIGQLGRVSALRPTSRTSVAEYAETNLSLQEIAVELGVGSVVEGDVQVLGERLRVAIRLVDGATDQQLWSETYDTTLYDVFAVQTDIAFKIVEEVGARLTDNEEASIAAAPTEAEDAYLLYLQGEEYRGRAPYSQQTYEAAERLYERALDLDSTFALAWASLSFVHGSLYRHRYDPRPIRLQRMLDAAETALRIAPDLPEARWAMGMAYYAQSDFASALEELTAAAEALPGSPELTWRIGYAHRRLGDWEQTLAKYEKAKALDPRNATVFADLGGLTFLILHRYEEAIEAYDRAIELAPDLTGAQVSRGLAFFLWRGELDTLRTVLRGGPPTFGRFGRVLWRLRIARWDGMPDSVLAILSAPEAVTFDPQGAYEPGLLHAAWAYRSRQDSAAAIQAFTGALSQIDSVLEELPDDWRVRAARGLALAGLGRRQEALEEANWLELSRLYKEDAHDRPDLMENRAQILAQIAETASALEEIERLLKEPSYVSAHLLSLEPLYDPIRDDPRFKALLNEYADPQAN